VVKILGLRYQSKNTEYMIPLILLQNLVELECENWARKGASIKYATRTSRKGFKAGALKKGMEWDYAKQSEYVAIFDADFQPEPDFLLRTVPFLVHNPEVGLVQAQWSFGKCSISCLRILFQLPLYHQCIRLGHIMATFLTHDKSCHI
jgi:cellulose synthase/poly-beta-1,6-N-acetylglucosamine synthase-like glycosyltransferase